MVSKEFNAAASNHRTMKDGEVAVVGGGITGLATAHYLDRSDVDFTLFEASGEPGGVIRSKAVDGQLLDVGPQRTRLSTPVRRLAEDVGIEDEVVTASEDLPLYVYSEGELRLAPTSIREGFRSKLLSPWGKVRMLAEPLNSLGDDSHETVEEFLRHRFGTEAYERYMAPLYGGIYASDPAEMPFRYSMGKLLEERGIEGSVLLWAARKVVGNAVRGREVPPPCSFEGGMQTLPTAVAGHHEPNVELETPVEDIGREDDDWWLEVDGSRRRFDRVVVATPASAAAELLEHVDEGSSEALGKLNYNELAVVHLACDSDVEALGFQTAFGEDLETLGATFVGTMFDRDGVVTCYLGGGRSPETLKMEDEELGETAERELEQVVDCDASVLDVDRVRMPAYDGSWRYLDDVEPPDDLEVVGSYVVRPGIPGRLKQALETAEVIRNEPKDRI